LEGRNQELSSPTDHLFITKRLYGSHRHPLSSTYPS
jgi:hypothetical protein